MECFTAPGLELVLISRATRLLEVLVVVVAAAAAAGEIPECCQPLGVAIFYSVGRAEKKSLVFLPFFPPQASSSDLVA